MAARCRNYGCIRAFNFSSRSRNCCYAVWLQISLWDLLSLTAASSTNPMQPVATTPIPTGDVQTRVCYNPNDTTELLTNGNRRTYFWRSQLPGSTLISYYSPPLRAADFHQEVGDFVASVFVPGTTQVCYT